MEWIKMTVAEKNGVCFSEAGSRYLLIQPGDENDLADLQKQTEEMERLSGGIPCTFCAFQVDNWFEDLSPWEAPPVFGKTGFGSGANATLDFLIAELIPALQERFGLGKEIPVFIGGYSLAGLFALYAAYSTRQFAGCAAVSPSVWFPNWNEYANSHEMGAPLVYLSLGAVAAHGERICLAVKECGNEQKPRCGKPGCQITYRRREKLACCAATVSEIWDIA